MLNLAWLGNGLVAGSIAEVKEFDEKPACYYN